MKRIIALCCTILLLASCLCSNSSNSNSSNSIKHGDVVTVTEQCIVAIDKDSYDLMTTYCTRRDERGLELMEAKGLIKIAYQGEYGTVTDMGFGKVKIRLDDNKEWWCANEFVR